MFLSDTPLGINSMKLDDILKFIDDEGMTDIPSPRVRLNYVKMLYDVLGFELSPDVALAAVAEPLAELVLSTAGGGKTTWSQIKAIEQKLIRKSKKHPERKLHGDQILCLVYNTHNVHSMKIKHAQMVNRLLAVGIEGLDIDDRINACTMHSFCEFCRKQFVAKLNYVGYTLLTEYEAEKFMRRAVQVACKIDKCARPEDIRIQKVHALYTLSKETLKPVEALRQTDLFTDLDLPISLLNNIFERFDSIKSRSRRFEFIDMLFNVYQLLESDDAALSYVQSYYEYVIADEVQDFTPLMWELLKLFVNDGTPLTCIGDEDQNIYTFRGANLDDILHFKDKFENGKIFTLCENRRCRSEILNEGKRIVQTNTLRFDKEIIGNKSGGAIKAIPYSTVEGQATQLIRELKKLPADDLDSTVVCYRNQECSMLLTEMMAEENITFNCLKANLPFSHELYQHVLGILNALEMPCDRDCFKQLWKVLPCKKTEFLLAIGFSVEKNKFTVADDKKHFAQFNYGALMNHTGFSSAMEALVTLSSSIDREPLTKIFPLVYKMLCTYYWEYKRSQNDYPELDDIFENRVKRKFDVPKRYSIVYREIQNVVSMCKNNTSVGAGVTLSTFHSLKGLEFKHVFATYLDNDIFPNFPLIEYKGYGTDVEVSLKEAETRLWFVAVTRAVDDLTFFYYRDNPSKYVSEYLEGRGVTSSTIIPCCTKTEQELIFLDEEDDVDDLCACCEADAKHEEPASIQSFPAIAASEQSRYLNCIFGVL